LAEPSMKDVSGQIQQFVSGLTMKQRALVIGGAMLVGATLWIFVRVLGTPDMKTLYSGLKPADVQTITGKLSAKSIAYQVGKDGTSIEVPADQLDRGRLETASQGLPRNARLGFEIFDTPNWLGTDFTEKVNYQRAMEGELERTIQTLGEVEAVRVHLVMPAESLFTDRERDGKAAVIVKTNGTLSPEKQFAIAQLVASSVDKLKPENVTVMDAETAQPLHPAEPGGAAVGGLGEQLSHQLIATLEPVVGAGHVRATVRVEYDLSSFEDTQETYDPKSTVAVSLQKSEENSGVNASGGIPGTASNTPSGPGSTVNAKALDTDRSSARSEAGTYVVNKLVRHTVQPSGRVKRITAAVIVDDAQVQDSGKIEYRKRTAEEMKNLEQIASAAVGLDNNRGDVLAVENLSFQQAPAEKVVAPSKVERARVVVSQWAGLLRYAGVALLFLVVYLTMLRPVKKQLLAAFKELPARLAAKGAKDTSQAREQLIQAEGSLEIGGDAQKIIGLKKQLADKVKVEPGAATKLVQSWMRETAR
jgi:flagellar M-ring protein FliF